MARQGKALPARTRPVLDESLFVRSAESLGRIIGSLQRQLDGASKAFDGARAARGIVGRANGHHEAATKRATKAPRTKSAKTAPPKAARVTSAGGTNVRGASKSIAAPVRAPSNGTTKRAAKPAAASKATSRTRPVAARKGARSGRSS